MVLKGHKSTVRSVCFDAKNEHHLLSGGLSEGAIRLWDAEQGTIISLFEGHRDAIYSIKSFSEGQRFVSVGTDKTIRVWDIRTQKCAMMIDAGKYAPMNDISICPGVGTSKLAFV
jgi:WD40 repeat protein